MQYVWKARIGDHSKKLVLLAMADNANVHGVCWPSIRDIAVRSELSERQVQRDISDMVERGWVKVLREGMRAGRGRKSTPRVYRLNLIRLQALALGEPPDGGDTVASPLMVATKLPMVATNRADGGDTAMSPEPSTEPSLEPSTTISPFALRARITDPPAWFLQMWNALCPQLPQVREMSQERVRKLGLRLKAHPEPEFWEGVLRRMNTSQFMRGHNERGWKATVDWLLLNDTNAVKVMEGKYANRGKTHGQAPPSDRDDFPAPPPGWEGADLDIATGEWIHPETGERHPGPRREDAS